ncbi:ATP-binding domain-containing protein 3 [Haematococcus lacustris]
MAPPRMCSSCQTARAVLKRPKNNDQLCRDCFYAVFEEEVHHTITSLGLFKRGERVALAASGGKDSTVLAHVVTTLNQRHDYGLDLFLLSIDEGISGYRDDSLETVKRNEQTYGIPLVVVSYKQLYDWTMDEIVAQIGTKNNCTFCGVFRRQALDRGAVLSRADKIATGHNADDIAETVLLNMLRGDVPRLGRCSSAITGEDGGLPRVKPFKYAYEKEIVMYAYFKRLDYFSTECVYAPFAARGFARDFIKDLEAARPSAILDLIRSADHFAASLAAQLGQCGRCGYLSSQPVCKACVLLEGLNRSRPGRQPSLQPDLLSLGGAAPWSLSPSRQPLRPLSVAQQVAAPGAAPSPPAAGPQHSPLTPSAAVAPSPGQRPTAAVALDVEAVQQAGGSQAAGSGRVGQVGGAWQRGVTIAYQP